MRDVFIIECEIGTLLFVYTADPSTSFHYAQDRGSAQSDK